MNEPTYAAVKTKGDYKITAVGTTYMTHSGTNMVLEQEVKVILDDVLYQGFYTEELALFAAMSDVKEAGKCDLSNVKWDTRPFQG
jgi:hypothetical protein